ncbi:MAG: aminopeptidase [Verrucomicrobia bacterium]|nr:aminopeptidase [Cytophagales bacterium]
MIKRILLGLALVLLIFFVWQYDLVMYGIAQGTGQFKVLYGAKPVEKFLQDPKFPDSLKQKLLLIQEIRKFAIDSLGINPSDNYTTLYDQQGKPLLWIVTACEPYALQAKEWDFPFIGKVSYKGFFDYEKVKNAENELKKQGYDTEIDEIAGWSTLGWFQDPILSSMLKRSEGQLANLIIHELTHGTLFVKSNLNYNENLAEFVGNYGALRFLAQKYGKNSKQYFAYSHRKDDQHKVSEHILRGARKLDSLYKTFPKDLSQAKKDTLKFQMIGKIVIKFDTLSLVNEQYKQRARKRPLPNNAFFIGYLTYRSQQNIFEKEFTEKFNANFPAYLAYLKEKYGK